MSLTHLSLADIKLTDLERLRDDEVRESKLIEYKLMETEKPKFLASVCPFANCMGGDLILGVREESWYSARISWCVYT
jgi:predicted HTH transcriptional regulator